MRTLVWFRGKDLRVHDHAPLADAAHAGEVVPVFVLDDFFFEPERARTLPHRMQFLLESLVELEASIERRMPVTTISLAFASASGAEASLPCACAAPENSAMALAVPTRKVRIPISHPLFIFDAWHQLGGPTAYQ